MSLLMDALRKAEQEKREAAKRLQEAAADDPTLEGPDASGQEGQAHSKREQADADGDTTIHAGMADPDISRTTTWALAPMDEKSIVPELDESISEQEQDPDLADDLTMELSVAGLSIEETYGTDETEEKDATDATEESDSHEQRQTGSVLDEDGVVSPFDETYHNITAEQEILLEELYQKTGAHEILTLEESAEVYDQTAPGAQPPLSSDESWGRRPTPVSARTVFSAGSSTRPDSGRKWAALAGIALIVAILLSGFWYYIAPTVNDIPSPKVASGVERYVPAVIGADEPADNISGTLNITREAGEIESDTEAKPEPRVAVKNVTPKATQPTMQARADLSETLELKPALIRISRGKSFDEQEQLIYQAYNSYREGDFVAAETLYRQVLEEFPASRDALLGIGAIALNAGDTARAFETYMSVLVIDPVNSVAKAAIISMQRNVDPLARESAIKTMLQGSPDVPFLHFILGNIYAGQARWPEAQQAFFDAYRYDSSNPDYALNLAISLDRLGQPQAAYDYYHAALKLVDNGTSMFDPAIVIERLDALAAVSNP